MAEGVVYMSTFMSKNFDKPNSKELNKEIGDKWKVLWTRRDRGETWYNMSLATSIFLICVANILYIVLEKGGKLKNLEDNQNSALLCNIQFIVGDENIFFIEFCLLLFAKIVIIVFLMIAVCRYLVVRSNFKKLIQLSE